MNLPAMVLASPPVVADGCSRLTVVLEHDAASRITYLRGKDGRLYRQADVAATEERAAAGDAVARAALAVVDFGVDASGAPVSVDDAFAAMVANREAWERGDFDDLKRIGELLPPTGRPRHTWAHARRTRREHQAERRRQRSVNTTLLPITAERAATLAETDPGRPGATSAR